MRNKRFPISDFAGTTLSKRLGTGQWGDVSFASSFGGELRSPTVLQTTQRERNCYLRQLMVDALDIKEFEHQNSACLPTASTRCQSQSAPFQRLPLAETDRKFIKNKSIPQI